MIQINGLTATYTDANGNTASVSAGDWNAWTALMAIVDRQTQAQTTNTKAVSDYNTALNTYQVNLNAGRAQNMAPPHKPQQLVISDTGVSSYVDFNPPLTDPIPPPTPSSVVVTGLVAQGTSTAAQPNQVETALISGLMALTNTLNSLVTALKNKGVI